MVKLIGIAVILIVSALIGNHCAENLAKRTSTLKAVEYMLEEMELLIRFRSADVYEIMDSLQKSPQLENLAFIKYAAEHSSENMPFDRLWEKSIAEYNESFLKKEDTALIESIGKDIGKSDLEGQISIIELKKNELSALIRSSEEEYTGKAGMYRSIGILGGALVSILLV